MLIHESSQLYWRSKSKILLDLYLYTTILSSTSIIVIRNMHQLWMYFQNLRSWRSNFSLIGYWSSWYHGALLLKSVSTELWRWSNPQVIPMQIFYILRKLDNCYWDSSLDFSYMHTHTQGSSHHPHNKALKDELNFHVHKKKPL